jgi:putative MATE family efflux protein
MRSQRAVRDCIAGLPPPCLEPQRVARKDRVSSSAPAGRASNPRLGVWALAWPAVVTNLLQSTVGLVDTKAVGTLGSPAVAAATAGHRMQFLLQALLMAASAGTTALVARAWGANDREEAGRVMIASLALGLGIAVVMGVLGLAIAEPFAVAFGLAEEPARLATIYIRWISVFNPTLAVGFLILSGLRAVGDMRTPLLIGATVNAVNVLLLYLFVYGGFGCPKLGIAGAALAGSLAFATASALSGGMWLRGLLAFRPRFAGALERARLRRLIAVGYPAALEQLVFQSGFIAFTFLMARHGTAALAAYGIGVQILSLSFVVGFGFSIAASTLVGQHLGARDPARATVSGWRAMRLAVASMSALSVLIIALAEPIARTMIADNEVVRLTVAFIYCLGVAQPLMAIDFALSGALRGAGDTRFPLFSTFASLIGGRVLLAALFTWLGLRVEWIYGALLADYIIKATLVTARFRSGRWKSALDDRAPSSAPAEAA